MGAPVLAEVPFDEAGCVPSRASDGALVVPAVSPGFVVGAVVVLSESVLGIEVGAELEGGAELVPPLAAV